MRRECLFIFLILAFLSWPATLFCREPDRAEYVSGEVLVQFRSGASELLAQSTHGIVGSTPIKRFTHVNVNRVRIPDHWTVEETVEFYRLDPGVEYVEPNYYRHATATPNDVHFGLQWGMHNIGQSGGTEDADLDGPEAWDVETGNSSIVVAVLDTGVALDHEDLAGNLWMNNGEDWVDGSPGNNGVDDDGNGRVDDYYGWDFANGDNDPDDDSDGHGTHVAGIIAAEGNNGMGITGVCWRASLMSLKTHNAEGIGLVSDEIEAIDYAIEKGAQVINASFGGSSFSQLEYDAIKRAGEAGVLFVAGAGNLGTDNDTNPVYPASHDLDNIISVAASDQNDHLGGSSNYGIGSVDVAAPGVNVYSTTVGNSYQYRSGTSMAAAHVSGLASLIWSEDFGMTCAQVKDRILNSVDFQNSLNGLLSTGGRVNAYNAYSNGPSPNTSASESEGGKGSSGGGSGGGGGCFIGTAASSLGW
jgi:subtilisin family serine protease